MRPRARPRPRAGFTLAEVAVTIVIIGIGLLLVLQGLNTAKLTAAHTRNMKLARELGMLTLGQIAAGQIQEDIETGFSASYAEEGYPDFSFEVALGDDTFLESEGDGRYFDNWEAQRQREEEREREDEEDEDEAEQPYERVKVRVTYPAISDLPSQLVLEQWVPWKQVYGEHEDDEAAAQEPGEPVDG